MKREEYAHLACGYDYILDYGDWKRRFAAGPLLIGY